MMNDHGSNHRSQSSCRRRPAARTRDAAATEYASGGGIPGLQFLDCARLHPSRPDPGGRFAAPAPPRGRPSAEDAAPSSRRSSRSGRVYRISQTSVAFTHNPACSGFVYLARAKAMTHRHHHGGQRPNLFRRPGNVLSATGWSRQSDPQGLSGNLEGRTGH